MNILTERINIVVGHYGSGKTNIAINFALANAGKYPRTVLIDLDIVNPYFRASDHVLALSRAKIEVISPNFANTNLETPSLPASIQGALADEKALVVLDVGGDDAGAIVLGRYEEAFLKAGYDCFYAINQRRPMTDTPETAMECLTEIMAVSKLRATALINNTNLGEETTAQIILSSQEYAKEMAKLAGLERIYTTALPEYAEQLSGQLPNLLPIDLYTKQYF